MAIKNAFIKGYDVLYVKTKSQIVAIVVDTNDKIIIGNIEKRTN